MVFGFGKKKKEDIEDVKEAITPKAPLLPATPKLPELDKVDIPPVSEPSTFAPLFIKVERYKEVLQKVQKLKSLINNISALAALQDEVEKIRTDANITLKKNIEEFANIASQLDQELVRPQHFEPFIKETGVQKVEGYTKELESEVEKMKEQLKRI